jgi:bifunctional non-homologous end joining protein LigD
MPVAVPVTWDELQHIDRSDAFSIADVEELLKRASSRELRAWGLSSQRLPAVT